MTTDRALLQYLATGSSQPPRVRPAGLPEPQAKQDGPEYRPPTLEEHRKLLARARQQRGVDAYGGMGAGS